MKKIIPCLDIKDGRVVKGVEFVDLKDMGDPVELARLYKEQGADELVFLDISKTTEGHDLMLESIRAVKEAIGDLPLTIGGGIASTEDVQAILGTGADKVSIASAAIRQPDLINQVAERFGSDKLCIALDVDFDEEAGDYFIYSKGGKQKEGIKAFDWIKEVTERGAGSLLITSISHDGSYKGFDINFLKEASQMVDTPIIASGGAGSIDDFVDLFQETDVAAGLAASIFHKGQVNIQDLKARLEKEGIN